MPGRSSPSRLDRFTDRRLSQAQTAPFGSRQSRRCEAARGGSDSARPASAYCAILVARVKSAAKGRWSRRAQRDEIVEPRCAAIFRAGSCSRTPYRQLAVELAIAEMIAAQRVKLRAGGQVVEQLPELRGKSASSVTSSAAAAQNPARKASTGRSQRSARQDRPRAGAAGSPRISRSTASSPSGSSSASASSVSLSGAGADMPWAGSGRGRAAAIRAADCKLGKVALQSSRSRGSPNGAARSRPPVIPRASDRLT